MIRRAIETAAAEAEPALSRFRRSVVATCIVGALGAVAAGFAVAALFIGFRSVVGAGWAALIVAALLAAAAALAWYAFGAGSRREAPAAPPPSDHGVMLALAEIFFAARDAGSAMGRRSGGN